MSATNEDTTIEKDKAIAVSLNKVPAIPSININGKNTFSGNITVLDTALTYNVNANQLSAGLITMGAGNLNLTVGNSVDSIAFANNSTSDWGTGNIVISNFSDDVISFGSADGITSAQLAAIDIGGGVKLEINSAGQISEVFVPGPRLNTGDIAFTGLNADSPDNLSFVLLTDVVAGTNFFIRDDEVTADGSFNGNGEGTVKWENTTGAVISAGTSVVIDSTYAGTITASVGTATKIRNR